MNVSINDKNILLLMVIYKAGNSKLHLLRTPFMCLFIMTNKLIFY